MDGQAHTSRVADLHRDDAWPFLVWWTGTGRLRVDAELLLAKPGGVDLAAVWDRLHPGDIDRAATVGRAVGWSANWVRQVSRHTLPVVCTWAAKTLEELSDEDLAGFAGEVEAAAHLSASARSKARTRLYAVGQVCYQLGLATRPPRRGVATPARTPVELAACVAQPAIRREIVRYAETISTVLRPASAYARIKAIRVFLDWLADAHPQVLRLDQLDRTAHLEPFLAGLAPGHGGAPTARGARSRSPSSTTTWSTCGSSSRTSPRGGGPASPADGCCSSPTCPACPNRCPGPSHPRPTPP